MQAHWPLAMPQYGLTMGPFRLRVMLIGMLGDFHGLHALADFKEGGREPCRICPQTAESKGGTWYFSGFNTYPTTLEAALSTVRDSQQAFNEACMLQGQVSI